MRRRGFRAVLRKAAGVVCAAAIAVASGGCASGPNGPFMAARSVPQSPAPALTPQQSEALARARAREEELLAQPLAAEAAAEIALLHHPAVSRALEALDMVDVDRLRLAHEVSPDFNNGRPPDTVEPRIERTLSVNVMTWLIGPALDPALTVEERIARVQAAHEIVALLFDARRAWVSAVATAQSTRYLEDVVAAAQASRELMQSMRRVGNASQLDALRAQRFYADAVARLAHAQMAAAVARERLAGALGLWGVDAERIQLPERLPDLPPSAVGPEGLEARALAQRLDVRAARAAGWTEEAGLTARTDVRSAWLAYRGAYDLASHTRDTVASLAASISAEQLKRYNGMLISVFDLIADATDRVNAVHAAFGALRDFWLAEVDLQQAMSGAGARPIGTQSPWSGAGGLTAPAYHVH